MYIKRQTRFIAAQFTDPEDTSAIAALGCTVTDGSLVTEDGLVPIPLNGWVVRNAASGATDFRVWTDEAFQAEYEAEE